MADKEEYLEELEQALKGMSPEALKLVAEFAKFLKRLQDNELAH
ncbi:hypothetical protein ES705_38569 [subsurface metagenome]